MAIGASYHCPSAVAEVIYQLFAHCEQEIILALISVGYRAGYPVKIIIDIFAHEKVFFNRRRGQLEVMMLSDVSAGAYVIIFKFGFLGRRIQRHIVAKFVVQEIF